MLKSVKTLDGFVIAATDGQLGRVKDIYFDDEQWTIRYFEVDTGGWLTGRRVLLSPISVTSIDWTHETIHVRLTKQEVQNSPGIETAKPVSRQHETALFNYYGYPYYWTGPYIWGYTAFPMMAGQPPLEDPTLHTRDDSQQEGDPHLRSKDEVVGYDIQATDESVGHVDDLLFDDKSWSIPLIVVDTRNWWPGKHVLISPKRIERVSWEEKSVMVNVTREQVESSPEYNPNHLPQEEGYGDVYWHMGRPMPVPEDRRDAGDGPRHGR
jgi:uncharacterized protein YrrD